VVIEPGADLDAQSPSSYLGKNDELHMAFNFAFLYSPWDGQAFKRVVIEWEKRLRSFEGWPNYTLSNHDQKRHITRYAWFYKTKHRAKSAAMMLLTLRGTPFLYYGEEIGMESQWIPKDRIQDPLGHTYWPIYVGRDNARTPMCWNSEKNAGFSNGESWLPVNDNYNIKNVEVESKDPNSLLNFYKKIIRFRKEHSALRNGSIWVLEGTNKHIMGFFRTNEEEKLAVLINLSASECGLGEHASEVKGKILFSISGKSGYFEDVVLAGFEGLIIRVDK
jgi:alpha-glucosidase